MIAAVDEALAALAGRYHFIAAVAELVDGTTPRLVFLIEFDEPVTGADGSVLVDRVDAALRLTSDTSFADEFAADRDLVGANRPSA